MTRTNAEVVRVGVGDRGKWGEVPLDVARALDLLAARIDTLEPVTPWEDGQAIRGDGVDGLQGSKVSIDDDGNIAVGDGSGARQIIGVSPAAGTVPVLTIRAADAISVGGGGSIILRPGAKDTAGSDGSVTIVDKDGVPVLVVAAALVSALQNISLTQAKRIDFDSDLDTSVRASADDTLDVEVGGSDVLQITATALDGKSALRLTNFAGRRETFFFGFGAGSTSTVQFSYGGPRSAITDNNAKRGHWMSRPGSIISVNIVCDVNVVGSGDTIDAQVRVNNVSIGFAAQLTSITVANGLEAENTQALGTDTFVRGDYLQCLRVLTGSSPGQVTTDDHIMTVEVEYDS